jgi:hypothetical protein
LRDRECKGFTSQTCLVWCSPYFSAVQNGRPVFNRTAAHFCPATTAAASLVIGISCETCHGPGAEHIAKERETSARPSGWTPRTILNPTKLERERQVDQCALCHNGTQSQELLPAFSYRSGEALDRYLAPDLSAMMVQPDVHGNQVGLL